LWFGRDAIDGIDPAVRALARSIMRHGMGNHRHPDLSRISPRLDVRVATIETPETADFADLWAMLRLPNRGTVAIPLHGNPLFDGRGGELCPVVQLCTDDADRISIRLVQDMAKPFAELRAAYEPKTERLGLDFGLATLIATSEGTLFGAGLINDLKRIDKQIVGIARHRARSGDKARDSQRYRKLVTCVRGMLKTRINATQPDRQTPCAGRVGRRTAGLPATRLVAPDEPAGDQRRPGCVPRQTSTPIPRSRPYPRSCLPSLRLVR
jgi:putative transposase